MKSVPQQWRFIAVLFLMLSLVFFLFEPWVVIIQFFLGFFAGLFVFRARDDARMSSGRFSGWFIAGFALLYVLFRLMPFYFAEHPLGYDTGIYRFEIWSSLQALPDLISGLFVGLPLVTNVFGLFGVPLDGLLYGGFLLSSFLLFYAVVSFVSERFGVWESLVMAFFLSFSVVQWEVYSMLLFKQVLALSLVFYSFSLFWKKSYVIVPVLLFLFLLQPLDLFLIILAFLLFSPFLWISFSDMRRYFLVLFGLGFLLGCVFLLLDPFYWSGLWDLFLSALWDRSTVEASLQRGVFLSLQDYGYQAAFFVVFGFLGFLESIRQKKGDLLRMYFLLLFFWILAGFFFYQRLLIQLDLVLMIFSAVSLVSFYRGFVHDRLSQILFLFLMVVLAIPFCFRLSQFHPSFVDEDFQQLTEFCGLIEADASIGVVDSFSVPWVRGACLRQQVFGPGMFANVWSQEDWELFWRGSDQLRIRLLLDEYSEPLYFFQYTQKNPIFSDEALFEDLGNGWWRKKD